MKLLKSYRIFFLSFLIACFLWLYVKLGSRYQKVVSVPLQIVNVKDGYGVVSEVPETISVLFEADGKTLLGLEYVFDVKYTLDLASYKENSKFIPSEHLQGVKLPPKVTAQVLSITSPDTFRIRTEKLITKTIPIRADFSVECASGFVLVGGFRVEPETITVTCPSSFGDSIGFLSTEHADFKNLAKDKIVRTRLASGVNKNIQYRPIEVSVALDVQRLGEIELENLPVRLVNVPSHLNLVVQPSTFSIKVRGGVDYLATLSRDSIQGVIDYAQEQRLNNPQPRLTILAPRDISWNQISPSRFNLVKLEADDFR
jgi:hypothetical protein